MPVPPVVMTASTSERASRSTSFARMPGASSLTMLLSTISCPAPRMSSTMVSPPVSVWGVRVSLMVRTATRTRSGADSLCLWTLSLKGFSPQKLIVSPLVPDGRPGSVAGVDPRLVRERQEPLVDAPHQHLHVPAEQVRPPHAAREERVPREHQPLALDVERQVPRRVPRRVQGLESQATDLERLPVLYVAVHGRHLSQPEPPHHRLGGELLEHGFGL